MDDIEKIRRLVTLVSDNDLYELELEEPDFRVKIKNQAPVQHWHAPAQPAGPGAYQQWAPDSGQQARVQGQPETQDEAEPDESLLEITSPMVGTLYRSPSEGTDPYVTVGDTVDPETVVCIVEAMKVMNEVKAGISGVIEEILVQNAEPVEYNQVLFLVRPSEDGVAD